MPVLKWFYLVCEVLQMATQCYICITSLKNSTAIYILCVQDVGCGIGGPARHIAAFSGAHITGLNFNTYQIGRCQFHTKNASLDHLCKYEQVKTCLK